MSSDPHVQQKKREYVHHVNLGSVNNSCYASLTLSRPRLRSRVFRTVASSISFHSFLISDQTEYLDRYALSIPLVFPYAHHISSHAIPLLPTWMPVEYVTRSQPSHPPARPLTICQSVGRTNHPSRDSGNPSIYLNSHPTDIKYVGTTISFFVQCHAIPFHSMSYHSVTIQFHSMPYHTCTSSSEKSGHTHPHTTIQHELSRKGHGTSTQLASPNSHLLLTLDSLAYPALLELV